MNKVPILELKEYREPSLFAPENLLREARRQKSLPVEAIPEICVLDPDGDILRWLIAENRARRSSSWACYHTDLYEFTLDGITIGIVANAVGAPFAVLVAEELFASGCRLLISISSAGQVAPVRQPPYFVLIERAVRDEGTSFHYLPPSTHSFLEPGLRDQLVRALVSNGVAFELGTSWTTDAPFRETTTLIEHHRANRVLCVEMEAAALYALREAKERNLICFAYVTNQMGQEEGDFEKGRANGIEEALRVISITARMESRMRSSDSGRFACECQGDHSERVPGVGE